MREQMSRGFIITPFEPELDWLTRLIREAGDEAAVKFERADDIFAPGVLINQILEALDDADVVVAVTTGKNANVFFELGYAWIRHRPILIAETTDDMPFDVSSWRHLLYGSGQPCHERSELRRQLKNAIDHVIDEGRPLPRGRVLASSPMPRQHARVSARFERHGRNSQRLVLHNSGTVEVQDVTIDVPPDATSFHVHDRNELPIDVLRPGEQVPLIAATFMGGGRRIFDVIVRGTTPDGTSHEWPSKITI